VKEELVFENASYHETCFKCNICNEKIAKVSLATSLDGKASHKECFTKQFATSGGKYGGGDVEKGAKAGVSKLSQPEGEPRIREKRARGASSASMQSAMSMFEKEPEDASASQPASPSKKAVKLNVGGGKKCAACEKTGACTHVC
jgi:hypothetical protein